MGVAGDRCSIKALKARSGNHCLGLRVLPSAILIVSHNDAVEKSMSLARLPKLRRPRGVNVSTCPKNGNCIRV